MECHNAAQESLLIKLQSQHATLKDSLVKLAALGEGLAKDKLELNRIVLQVGLCGFSHIPMSSKVNKNVISISLSDGR